MLRTHQYNAAATLCVPSAPESGNKDQILILLKGLEALNVKARAAYSGTMLELQSDIDGSKNASGLDPLGRNPIERHRRIEAMRMRRWRESPNSDLNILLFAYDEMRRDCYEMGTQLLHKDTQLLGCESTKVGA